MIEHTDKMSASKSWERAQRLYEKNIELENNRRKSAKARVPSDPGVWQQIRDNCEAIILEDHGFSEKHNIEYALWQLLYRRIEELRAQFHATLSAVETNKSEAGKTPAKPDPVAKIRLQFKTFLSEATGFYHDLILKIRAKYGLPLGYFSEDSCDIVSLEKDRMRCADVKRGLISCHQCLIYLGDLARYKGNYGEGDSKTREHAAASSYYLQAASIWPSSGNPYHQLAILATYSGGELMATYWYFRSLAVDNPFITARENLILAFEKNRQSYAQLSGDIKISNVKMSSTKLTGKGRRKGETKRTSTNLEVSAVNGRTSNTHEIYRLFCICFVRLNGIIFTRTSMETFEEVLLSVSNRFLELVSSGPEEELNFGVDAVENALFIVRLVSVLIFTVHNVKESEGQTYAENVQRAVLLQNACIAIFEFVGHMLERSMQLHNPSSSYLLPGILIFLEWLECCPDIASGNDVDGKQAAVRMNFWRHCISFMNKILLLSSISFDDKEDESCFNNMTLYEDGKTGNCCALWEDFELRGFLPLVPAQTILNYSQKQSFGNEGSKEKGARIRRILAAGKSLINVVRIDGKTVCFNSEMKKFMIGHEPQISEDAKVAPSSDLPKVDTVQELQPRNDSNLDLQPVPKAYVDGEEDDEVIVFKPVVIGKGNDLPHHEGFKPVVTEKSNDLLHHEGLRSNHNASVGNLQHLGGSFSPPFDHLRQQQTTLTSSQIPIATSAIFSQIPISTSTIFTQNQPVHNPPASKWLMEEAAYVANRLKSVRFMENGHASESGLQNKSGLQKNFAMVNNCTAPSPVQQSTNMYHNQTETPQVAVLPKVDMPASSGVIDASINGKSSAALLEEWRKSTVSRPVRHLGPPPGFNPVPAKQEKKPVSNANFSSENPLTDDYSWLDGYKLPPSTNGSVLGSSINFTSCSTPQYFSSSNGLSGAVNFPFPGKHVPQMHFLAENQKGFHNNMALEHLWPQQEQQTQPLTNGNQQFTMMHNPYRGQSIWDSRYIG